MELLELKKGTSEKNIYLLEGNAQQVSSRIDKKSIETLNVIRQKSANTNTYPKQLTNNLENSKSVDTKFPDTEKTSDQQKYEIKDYDDYLNKDLKEIEDKKDDTNSNNHVQILHIGI